MRRILYFLLVTLLIVPGMGSAKLVEDNGKVFSVEIPEDWKFDPKIETWYNADSTIALKILSVDCKISLDEWAKKTASQNPNTAIYKDTLGGIQGRRLEYTPQEGWKACLWIAKKGQKGAIATLVYSEGCSSSIPNLAEKLISSFAWKSAGQVIDDFSLRTRARRRHDHFVRSL